MVDIGNGRALRVCDLCGGVDDHPRHTLITSGVTNPFPPITDDILGAVITAAAEAGCGTTERARLLRELQDRTAQDRHLDCCRNAGCPLPADDPTNCATRTTGAEHLRGAELLDHLEAQ